MDKLVELLDRFVPSKQICALKSSHPWLNDRCRNALARKRAASGTDAFLDARDECSRTLADEYNKYVSRMRARLGELSSSSHAWWRLSDSLMMKRTSASSIPPLKRTDGSWAINGQDKAELFAEVFAGKYELPEAELNEHTPFSIDFVAQQCGFLPIRVRQVRRTLKALNSRSATGPDGIGVQVLRECAEELALPIAILLRRILVWLVPIFKKKSRADASNYRDVHLTAQLSKVAERVLGVYSQRFSEKVRAYGKHQFAYSKKMGHRDALAYNIMSWLMALEDGGIIGFYGSDVSAAFDRVAADRLLQKLALHGLHQRLLAVISSWLAERRSSVVVEGSRSRPRPLANSVYQGTVWGPPLWNIHYSDVKTVIRHEGFSETVYADDLNAFKSFPRGSSPQMISAKLRQCQSSVHRWGRANQVLFDGSKESFHIIHRLHAVGEDFKLLGVVFDCKLSMHSAVRTTAVEAGWRLRSLLRVRRFHSLAAMVRMYKTHILSYIESGVAAYAHAAASVVAALDRVQDRFLREMGISKNDAAIRFKLLPLSVRRNIALLGVIHRAVLKEGPLPLHDFFPLAVGTARSGTTTRAQGARHNRQVLDFCDVHFRTDMFRRSAFGYVSVYNALPQHVIDSVSVKCFQHKLQAAVFHCISGGTRWEDFLQHSDRQRSFLQFQSFFVR